MGCSSSVPQPPAGRAPTPASYGPTATGSSKEGQLDEDGPNRPVMLQGSSNRGTHTGDGVFSSKAGTGSRMPKVTKGSSQDGGTQDARIPARSTEGSPFYDMAYASNKAKERTGWTASQEAMDVPVELPQSALSNVKQMRVYSDSGSSSFSALGTRLESSSGIGPRRPRPSADAIGASEGDAPNEDYVHKARRHGVDDLMREHVRRMALGRGNDPQEEAAMEISDSDDDEDVDLHTILRETADDVDMEQAEFLKNTLSDHFIFRGLSDELLTLVLGQLSGVCLPAHAIIVEQGSLPRENDCMFIVTSGEVEVVIAGGGPSRVDDTDHTTDGHLIRMGKGRGWVFGDMTLLFNTPRSASVVSKTPCTLWALEKSIFLAVVMKHATGARALRFVRKLPLLKGLSDNVLFDVAERMTEETYEDGEALIKYGERGHKLFLIRYGMVDINVPLPSGETLHVNTLGRGHFVGERTLITSKLRSADCFARGPVTAIVMMRQDFLQLDNPLLGWMLDYDAMATVMQSLPQLSALSNDLLEMVIDKFEREDCGEGMVVATHGEPIHTITVVKIGQVACIREDGEVKGFVQESAGGFFFFGEGCLQGKTHYPGDIVTVSPNTTLLSIHRRELIHTLRWMKTQGSHLDLTDEMKESACLAMQHCKALNVLKPDDITLLASSFEVWELEDGEMLTEYGDPADQIYGVYQGELEARAPEDGEMLEMPPVTPKAGANMKGLWMCRSVRDLLEGAPRAYDLVAKGPAVALVLKAQAVQDVLGLGLEELLRHRMHEKESSHDRVAIDDLEMHRVVGTGQFGMVRMVRHKKTQEVFAFKMLSKAAGMQKKQLEHLRNERIVLEEARSSPFCTRLVQAYQDSKCLYMLQEWVPGGELFYHLDMQGAFDEETTKFYTASTLLALEHLHQRGIVYRDLKPENLLLDATGNIKMADFGFAKRVGHERTYTICGTPDYQAPEVIMRKGTGAAADHWSLGVLVFEMMVGDPPFKSMSGDPWDTFRLILSGRFYVPDFVPELAADLIYSLLQTSVDSRLGSGPEGAAAIKAHPWFDGFDWAALEARTMPVPITPVIKDAMDTSNFDTFDSDELLPDWVTAAPTKEQHDESAYSWDLWEWVDDLHTT